MRLLAIALAAALIGVPGPAAAADCSTDGCTPGDEKGLDPASFDRLLEDWNDEAMTAASLPLETLLFHGERTRALLATVSDDALSPERRAFLERELDRDSVTVEMRLVDAKGRVRGEAGAQDIPLVKGRRLAFEGTGDLGFLITGGKVKRVGLDHLWSRW